MCFNTLVNLGVAIGTIAVAIAAIWGDWLRDRLNPSKARIAVHNVKGKKEGDPARGGRLIFYHLKVVNETRWKTLHNSRVLLTEIQRKHPDGSFHVDPFPVPRQFVWAPSELSPIAVSFSDERIFDFGVLYFSDATFRPSLYVQGGELNANVTRDQAVRYRLEIVADNFHQRAGQLFEVAFNGVCSEDLEEMSRNLVIREVTTGRS
jgi:hypothetical protein